MRLPHSKRKPLAVIALLTGVLIAGLILRASPAGQAGPQGRFSGQVTSANGTGVPGATVFLVPTAAMDTRSRLTASSIYAAPFPAENYDEPLEDAIRLHGKEFPQAVTDARGNFAVGVVP